MTSKITRSGRVTNPSAHAIPKNFRTRPDITRQHPAEHRDENRGRSEWAAFRRAAVGDRREHARFADAIEERVEEPAQFRHPARNPREHTIDHIERAGAPEKQTGGYRIAKQEHDTSGDRYEAAYDRDLIRRHAAER